VHTIHSTTYSQTTLPSRSCPSIYNLSSTGQFSQTRPISNLATMK
jgi:hypothetical protein